MLPTASKLPKRIWLLPLVCACMTVLSIAYGGERKQASRRPASTGETPIYSSRELRDPSLVRPSWARGARSGHSVAELREAVSVPVLHVSIDRSGRQFEGAPDSFRRVYFRR